MTKYLLGYLLCICSLKTAAQQQTYNVLSFGAVADGITNNAVFIQKAIDLAGARGGKVIIPSGRFLTGPIQLRSNVELHLSEGAVILGSTKRLDYGEGNAVALIAANNLENISLTGKGTIDGQGRELVKDLISLLHKGIFTDPDWQVKRPTEAHRPRLIVFKGCKNIKVTGLRMQNGAGWIQDYVNCDGLIIDSLHVESTAYWNNDGIDIVNSKNVRITNCYVDAADDAIVLKSEGSPGWCENVYVADCTLRSSANAFKLGTGSYGGFKKITVRNLRVFNTYRSAIALEAVDGGFLEDIDIRNVQATYTGNAILIRLGHRNNSDKYSTLNRVYIGDVRVEVPSGKPDAGYPVEGPALKYPHNVFPSSITGIPGHPVKDVTLENIEIVYGGGARKERAYFGLDSLDKVPENIKGYPEFSMFGELPAWGLYVRHIEGLTLKNIKLSYNEDDFRPACVFDDVTKLAIDGLSIPSAQTLPILVLKGVRSPLLKKIILKEDNSKAIKTIN
jgi:hypothetical protein